MQIQMKDIKPASNELRESYDKDSLLALQWSLMEEGQVEPIKVCKNGGSGYEIVYGHRRYFAAQNAGWDEIEAIVVDKDEVDNLIHAGIENLAGNDLTIMEKANWVDETMMAAKSKGEAISFAEISRRSTVPSDTISRWLTTKGEVDLGLLDIQQANSGALRMISNVVSVFPDNPATRKILYDRILDAGYGQLQAKVLAQAYKNAETPELKEQVLHTGVGKNDTWEDVLHKARFEKATRDQFPETFVFKPEWERELMSNENTHPYVRKFYGSLNSARRHILLGPLFVQQDLFKPSEAKATIMKIDATIKELDEYKRSLQGVL
jgi:ParB/RepB/Spo0J family partition protein